MKFEELAPIIAAVEQASALCQRVQDRYLTVDEKEGGEPVTIADYGSQAIICRAISLHFPNDGILAEESGQQFVELVSAEQKGHVIALISEILGEIVTQDQIVGWLDFGHKRESNRRWVIDPIDGTKGFMNKRRYTIAVGFLENHLPLAGIMGCPGYPYAGGMGMVIYGIQDTVYAKALYHPDATPTQVSTRHLTDEIRLMESFEREHVDHEMMHKVYATAGLTNPVMIGLDGQDKYAMIANGDGELYLRIPPTPTYRQRSWDHAAGVAIVQAAGGRVSDLDGSPIDFSTGQRLTNNKVIVATNGLIHDEILAALRTVLAE